MISRNTLKNLSIAKLEDAKILSDNGRNDSSIYIVGYAVELALKYKICKIFRFDDGFPENKSEFNTYITEPQDVLVNEIKTIKDIRNHDLQKLLYYSGQEFSIKEKAQL